MSMGIYVVRSLDTESMKQYLQRTGMSAWSAHCRPSGWIAPQASRSNRICAPSRSIMRFHAYASLPHSLTHSPSVVSFPLTVLDRWDDGNEGFFGRSSGTNEDMTPSYDRIHRGNSYDSSRSSCPSYGCVIPASRGAPNFSQHYAHHFAPLRGVLYEVTFM